MIEVYDHFFDDDTRKEIFDLFEFIFCKLERFCSLENKIVGFFQIFTNGKLISQLQRTQDNHCDSCNSGYKLSNKTCIAYAGSCTNGNLITFVRS